MTFVVALNVFAWLELAPPPKKNQHRRFLISITSFDRSPMPTALHEPKLPPLHRLSFHFISSENFSLILSPDTNTAPSSRSSSSRVASWQSIDLLSCCITSKTIIRQYQFLPRGITKDVNVRTRNKIFFHLRVVLPSTK